MRRFPIRLAPLPTRNAIALTASAFSAIGGPDPVPPDQINTSPDLILAVSIKLLKGKSAQEAVSPSPALPTPLYSFLYHYYFIVQRSNVFYMKYSLAFLYHCTFLLTGHSAEKPITHKNTHTGLLLVYQKNTCWKFIFKDQMY